MLKKSLILILSIVLIAGLVACGGSNDGDAVADFLEEHIDEMQASVAPMLGPMGSGSRVDIEAGAGNEMVFTFVYGYDIDAGMIDAVVLEEALYGLGHLFEPLAEALRDEIGVDSLRILVRYANSYGEVLAEKGFYS